MAFQQVSIDWHSWIKDNLARGCDEASIISTMVQGGIDPVAAGIALLQGMSPPAQADLALAPPSGYHYTTPRFPPVGNVIQTRDRAVRVAMRITQPMVAVLDDFMSKEECDELVQLSRAKLQRSTIVDPATGQDRVIEDRKSSGTFFALNENPLVARLDQRISDVMRWPVENGEGIQILNYQIGGEYKNHFDYFPPDDPGSAVHLAKGGQRVSTLVMYLNDVEQGGETIFPSIHLSVTPKKGSAVYFEYCNDLGQVDSMSLHGGVPVIAGEKWIATKWMRQRRYT
jgi:prolyl 4-hydroxylase